MVLLTVFNFLMTNTTIFPSLSSVFCVSGHGWLMLNNTHITSAKPVRSSLVGIRHNFSVQSSHYQSCNFTHPPTLRSSSEELLKIFKRNLTSVGNRSFRFFAQTVWNLLPVNLWNLPTLSDVKAQLKNKIKNFPFSTGISTNLGGPLCVCVCV